MEPLGTPLIATAPTAPSAAGRHLLLITFHYPPSNTSSGGLRPLKFGKYLREFGWESSVLTVSTRCHESTDDALLHQIPPGVAVHRSFCFDTKAALSIRGKYPGFLAVPDRYLSWLPSGIAHAIRGVRRGEIHALFSTSPIPTTHLIALAVKRMTGIPWVADFRDPWVETDGSEVHAPLRQSVELWLERQVVQQADRILVTTREFGDYLTERYGVAIGHKIEAVYNGYDEDDFDGLIPQGDATDCFTLVHAGLLDPHYRNPEPILQAVRQCLDRGIFSEGKFRLRFIGSGALADSGALDQLIATFRLEGLVQTVGRMAYRQALASLAGAAALLLLQGGDDTRMLIPAKAFEYLRTGRLIIAAAPAGSATANLIHEFAGGFIAEPNDRDDIARQLTASFDAWSRGTRHIDRVKDGLSRYSRRNAAAQLAQILDTLSGAAGTDRGASQAYA